MSQGLGRSPAFAAPLRGVRRSRTRERDRERQRDRDRDLGAAFSDEEGSTGGSTSVISPRMGLWWCCTVATGLLWACLLIRNTLRMFRPMPVARDSDATLPLGAENTELVVRPWRDRVKVLEASVSTLKAQLKDRDLVLMRLRGGGSLKSSESDLLAQSLDRHGVGLTTRLPDTLIDSFHSEKANATGVPRAPPGSGFFEYLMGGTPAASTGDSATASCLFVDDVDYPSSQEEVFEHLTEQECCQLCAKRNTEKPGSCAVGVLSADHDSPPRACWLKAKVNRAVMKEGVRACWPPASQNIPKLPPQQHASLQPAAAEDPAHLQYLARLKTDFEIDPANPDPAILRKRSELIRGAVKHAWDGYKKFAWGKDELRPKHSIGVDSKFRHAVTMVDALSTLWIVGLREEFAEAKAWLAQHMPDKIAKMSGGASVFETTIRTLGGLLSSYDLSGDDVFLDLSLQLARRILNTMKPGGITPYTFSGASSGGAKCQTLAESGTIQLEMRYLSHVTGDRSFAEKYDQFYNTVRRYKSVDGLWPICYAKERGKITFGADGDSFYEYLLKVWLQGDRSEDFLWEMYNAAASGLENRLVKRNDADGLDYLVTLQWTAGRSGPGDFTVQEEMEHLGCFVPGWLALGASYDTDAERAERRRKLATSLANTCWEMYNQQPTGIGPERVKSMRMDLSKTDTREYILRPEALEGWWYMHELTKDPRYREWGWRTFTKFEEWLWVPHGYASLKDVRSTKKTHIDRMESFWLAETLKYAYLLQDPDNNVTLDRYVFNTEAHPLSILKFARVRGQPSKSPQATAQ